MKTQEPLVTPSGPVTLDSDASLVPIRELVTEAVMLMGCGAAAPTTTITVSTTKHSVTFKLISGTGEEYGRSSIGRGNVISCLGYVLIFMCIFMNIYTYYTYLF